MTITMVAAVGRNGVIGRDGDLAWRNSEDLQHAKRLTLGRTLVMGRRTFDSIGRPLPGRRTIVITRQTDWSYEGVTVTHSVDQALAAAGCAEVVIFGGGDLYAQLIDRADRLEITHVEAEPGGDVYFPTIDPTVWRQTHREQRDGFAWATYQRSADGDPAVATPD